MSTTETVRAWATTNAGNAAVDAAIASSDAQSPDTIDNNIRSIMVAVRKQMNDIGGSLAAGGTANALTVTTGQVLESGQITDGLRILLKATADNANATVTFAPDGLTAAGVKRADGSALAVGSIKSGMYLDLVYNSAASEWRCANIAPAAGVSAPGLVFLTSGTVSAAATLDIVLTAYTQYRGLKFVLGGFVPASDATFLLMRFSSDGGGSYDAGANNYGFELYSGGVGASSLSTSIALNAVSGTLIGNASTEGMNVEITMLNHTSAALYTRVTWSGAFMTSAATAALASVTGAGARLTAQDTDAVRFLFAVGNISAGNYAVYGLV